MFHVKQCHFMMLSEDNQGKGSMENYWIQVFNQETVWHLLDRALVPALRQVHYESLCQQYGLDQSLIASTRSRLEIISAPESPALFKILQYQPPNNVPLLIFHWDSYQKAGGNGLGEPLQDSGDPQLRERLLNTREVLGISLRAEHLQDLGLLLAYEVARWAAFEGQGLVYGLDGTWYRLNRHQAFLPLVDGALD